MGKGPRKMRGFAEDTDSICVHVDVRDTQELFVRRSLASVGRERFQRRDEFSRDFAQ